MNIDKILSIVKKKNLLLIDTQLLPDTPVIIDFYNLYCNIIQFNKYKTFSRKTYILCMNLLLKKFKNFKQVIIVSKNIFEVELDYIKNITLKYSNVKYLIIKDEYITKGENRERDDYVCLLSHYYLLESGYNPAIITNDRYKNYKSLVKNTKDLIIYTYSKGNEEEALEINKEIISKNEENLIKMCENQIKTIKFKFVM